MTQRPTIPWCVLPGPISDLPKRSRRSLTITGGHADHYGWTHIVLLSNDDTSKTCWFGAKSFDEVFSNDENYTFTWLRYGSRPTDEELDNILQQIRALTRGFILACEIYIFCVTQLCTSVCPSYFELDLSHMSMWIQVVWIWSSRLAVDLGSF